MKRRYTILLEQDLDTDTYTVTVPLLPGCITQGSNRQQAIERAEEAIRQFIVVLQEDGEDVPMEEGSFALETVEIELGELERAG